MLHKKKAKVAQNLLGYSYPVIANLTKEDLAYKTIRAVLVTAMKESDWDLFDFENTPAFGSSQVKSGTRDYNKMFFHQKDLSKTKRRLQRVDTETVKQAVMHILDPKFIDLFAYGVRMVKIPGEDTTVTLPNIIRTCSIAVMYKDYVKKYNQLAKREEKNERPGLQTRYSKERTKRLSKGMRLSRAKYYEIASKITKEQTKTVQSIDYINDRLVNEPFDVMRTIVIDLVAPAVKDDLIHYLEVLQNFLKYNYDDHIHIDDDKVRIRWNCNQTKPSKRSFHSRYSAVSYAWN